MQPMPMKQEEKKPESLPYAEPDEPTACLATDVALPSIIADILAEAEIPEAIRDILNADASRFAEQAGTDSQAIESYAATLAAVVAAAKDFNPDDVLIEDGHAYGEDWAVAIPDAIGRSVAETRLFLLRCQWMYLIKQGSFVIQTSTGGRQCVICGSFMCGIGPHRTVTTGTKVTAV